jgi:hypothetical protein
LKNVLKDVLEVKQLRGVADVDKLRGHLPMHTRRLVVRDPKFGRRARRGAVNGGSGGGHFSSVEREKGGNSRSWGGSRRAPRHSKPGIITEKTQDRLDLNVHTSRSKGSS